MEIPQLTKEQIERSMPRIMEKRYKELILLGCLLFLSFTFIMIGAKMTPQWIEFQQLSRVNYLIFSFIFLTIGVIFLLKPIKYMIIGTRNN